MLVSEEQTREVAPDMKNAVFRWGAALMAPLVILGACSSDSDCSPGHEGCACAESACLAGLVCASGLCVDPGNQVGPGNQQGQPGSGGSAGVDVQQCRSCWEAQCDGDYGQCQATDSCGGLADCAMSCIAEGDFQACPQDCTTDASDVTAEAVQAFGQFWTCAVTSCVDECFTLPDVGAGGTGGDFGSGGDPGSGGAAADGGSGGMSSSGGSSSGTGGRLGVGGNSGVGGSGGSSGNSDVIHWLSFDDAWADSSVPENAAVGISGGFYVYGDDCAMPSVEWDPEGRCVSGTLCSSGAEYENWGVAVGFDFHNTGEEGEPPNTKFPWDATEHDALGLAWTVSGVAPGLQVWVTNIAPAYDEGCTEDECAIAGPPDGKESTVLGAVDRMYFGPQANQSWRMVKDNWGGAGEYYTFNPRKILALQFKMASIVSGAGAFSFCIDEIGVIQ